MVPDLVIIGSDNLDRTITVRIKGIRYEYWFHGEVPLTTIRKILRYSHGRAIGYLEKRSYKVVRVTPHGEEKKEVEVIKV